MHEVESVPELYVSEGQNSHAPPLFELRYDPPGQTTGYTLYKETHN